ncbi:MAG: hypothetical protein K8J31_15900 [Anaerolineae bacterium]|nr:hypothetical protein [Anaerolineae bacterium]
MPRLFATISTLPGGTDRYLDTLMQALRWVAETPQPKRGDLLKWFSRHFHAADRSCKNYIQMVVRLDVIRIDGQQRILMTAFGRRLLTAEREEQSRLVADFLADHFIGIAEILTVYAAANRPIHVNELSTLLAFQFPMWTHITPYAHRVLWLVAVGSLAQVRGQEYQITNLGHVLNRRHPMPDLQRSLNFPPLESVGPCRENALATILEELETAAIDSRNPQRFQAAAATAFRYLGFDVEERGNPGDTDLLINAQTGADRYSAVVDTKSRWDGKLREVAVVTLEEHRQKNGADYAVVIAGAFAEGQVVRQAEGHGILLLDLAVFCEWLRLHARNPLNLLVYRAVFVQPGLARELPNTLMRASRDREVWTQLLEDVIGVLREVYDLGLNQSVTTEQLFGMLVARFRSVSYSREQIERVLELLSHPLIDLIVMDERHGVTPAKSWSSFLEVQRWVTQRHGTAQS